MNLWRHSTNWRIVISGDGEGFLLLKRRSQVLQDACGNFVKPTRLMLYFHLFLKVRSQDLLHSNSLPNSLTLTVRSVLVLTTGSTKTIKPGLSIYGRRINPSQTTGW